MISYDEYKIQEEQELKEMQIITKEIDDLYAECREKLNLNNVKITIEFINSPLYKDFKEKLSKLKEKKQIIEAKRVNRIFNGYLIQKEAK